MSGVLSSIFDGGNDDGASQQSQTTSAGTDGAIDLSPEVTVGHEIGGSYQNLDGSTTTWSSDSEVTVTVDLQATYAAGTEWTSSDFEG
jgi:hypothetical protein